MDANATADAKSGISLGELWAGVLVGPIAMLTQLEVNYALVLSACANHRTGLLHVVSLFMMLITLMAGLISYRLWARLRANEDAGTPVARGRLMAAIGVLISLLMAGVIIAQWLPIFIHGPCER